MEKTYDLFMMFSIFVVSVHALTAAEPFIFIAISNEFEFISTYTKFV